MSRPLVALAAPALLALGLVALDGASAPAAAATQMRLCTGSPGKTYVKVGEKLADLADQFTMGQLEIEVVPTGGSIDNLNLVLEGKCDGFIAQGDAIAFYADQVNPAITDAIQLIGPLYKELGLLLCSRASGIDDLDEASGATIAAGNMGTGSLATLLNLQRIEPDTYGGIKIYPANGFEGALAVLDGKADCVFDVIAPQSDLVQTLNDNERTGAQLYFAEIDNSDLEDFEIDDKQVYELVTFDDELYGNLAVLGDPETLAINAMFGVSRAFVKESPEALSALSMLMLAAAKDVETVAYGESRPFD